MARKKKKNQIIGSDEVRKAIGILEKYKAGKSNLDSRIIDNSQWFELHHWSRISEQEHNKIVEPTSAWLFNSIINKHADAMDSYPEAQVLPREESDREDASTLTSVIHAVFDQNHYEDIYSNKWWDKLKNGCSCEGVFWNPSLNNGLGDIDIKNIDILNLFWKPGIKDLEDSPNLFHLQLMDNERLLEDYPELEDEVTKTPVIETGQYIYDDNVDTTDMTVVVDWYYKKKIDGRMTLQYCKFVNDTVLYASENDEEAKAEGWYAHGMYPFVLDIMFPLPGTPAGFGYLDIMKDPQLYIDKLSGAILENAKWNAKPRFFKRGDDGINEDELLDTNRPVVHVEGNLDDNNIRPMTASQVPSTAFNVLSMKIDELKETSGNRDVSQGGTTSGISAASAIAALQEAGSKLTRDSNKTSYRAFEKIANRVLELIRQFYDEERCFRITAPNGETEFVNYSNQNIKGQAQGSDFGLDLGARLPMFDFNVKAQKANAFSTIGQNQMAQQLFQMGFFNPQMADQAIACLEMMDFEGKDQALQKISQNQTLFEQLQQAQESAAQLAAMYDGLTGGNEGQQILMGGQMEGQMAMNGAPDTSDMENPEISNANNPLGRASRGYRNTTAMTARERARNVGAPK